MRFLFIDFNCRLLLTKSNLTVAFEFYLTVSVIGHVSPLYSNALYYGVKYGVFTFFKFELEIALCNSIVVVFPTLVTFSTSSVTVLLSDIVDPRYL